MRSQLRRALPAKKIERGLFARLRRKAVAKFTPQLTCRLARRAIRVHATANRLVCFANQFRAANGAVRRHLEGLPVAALLHDAHHFWDDVAATLDEDRIPDVQAQARDFVFVVQRGI